jgi:hypothetical protein
MILSQYAKALVARHAQQADPEPDWPRTVAARAVTALNPEVDGTGTWLVAGLVDVHDEVNADGTWHAITGTRMRKPCGDLPGDVVLYFAGRREPVDHLALVYARDAAGAV